MKSMVLALSPLLPHPHQRLHALKHLLIATTDLIASLSSPLPAASMGPGVVPSQNGCSTDAASNQTPKMTVDKKRTIVQMQLQCSRGTGKHFANSDRYEGGYMDGIGPHGAGRYVFASGACTMSTCEPRSMDVGATNGQATFTMVTMSTTHIMDTAYTHLEMDSYFMTDSGKMEIISLCDQFVPRLKSANYFWLLASNRLSTWSQSSGIERMREHRPRLATVNHGSVNQLWLYIPEHGSVGAFRFPNTTRNAAVAWGIRIRHCCGNSWAILRP